MNSSLDPIELSLSIVSHGQGAIVTHLLQDLQIPMDISCELLLTLNRPEDERFLDALSTLPFPVQIIRNGRPKGYGSNHNAAFRNAKGRYFAVINPDIRLIDHHCKPLLELIDAHHAGVCAPAAFLSNGGTAPGARRFPTWRFLLAKLLGRTHDSEYPQTTQPFQVDWVSGMFMVFPRAAFEHVGGFDERYFMYYEDADLCRRLGKAGWGSWVQPACRVVHDGQYASRRNLKHLYWHLSSAIRFLASHGRPGRP
ncbi:glycosyltransferase [Hydrogenophaga sp.]|uniref:glycosyltransferase n=1 Tax=Hydrogenophaga sp. TaxID=1904254 RepID=UPI003F6C00ED